MKHLDHTGRHAVNLELNGVPRRGLAESRTLLSDFLRHELGATGTHVGCEHGVCGACTVHIDGVAARACLTLAVQADGRRIDTVEGLAGADGTLNDLHRPREALEQYARAERVTAGKQAQPGTQAKILAGQAMAWGQLGDAGKREDYYRRALAELDGAEGAALLTLRKEIATEAGITPVP